MKYVALLRGINVGGHNLISMSELKTCFEKAGFDHVKTYIQSGNIIFETDMRDKTKIVDVIESAINTTFSFYVFITLVSHEQLQQIVTSAPHWWGKDPDWKHNLLVLLPGREPKAIIDAIGPLKPNIEAIAPGDGVVYQSILFAKFGQTTSGKLASKPEYKYMTIRNYNTTIKLLALMDVS